MKEKRTKNRLETDGNNVCMHAYIHTHTHFLSTVPTAEDKAKKEINTVVR
jgi:hypothetical protein